MPGNYLIIIMITIILIVILNVGEVDLSFSIEVLFCDTLRFRGILLY